MVAWPHSRIRSSPNRSRGTRRTTVRRNSPRSYFSRASMTATSVALASTGSSAISARDQILVEQAAYRPPNEPPWAKHHERQEDVQDQHGLPESPVVHPDSPAA